MKGKIDVRANAKRHTGFSLTELVVALAIAMVLMAVGLPAFLRAYRSYQLSNAATEVADILRLARYEAIRRNTLVNCVVQATGTTPPTTNMWVDSAVVNGAPDPTEKIIVLGSAGNLISPPGTAPPISSDVGTLFVNTPSATASTVQFDARGAVKPPTRVNVFYLASEVAPEAGYRAVVLMPAGAIQIWQGDSSGNWAELR